MLLNHEAVRVAGGQGLVSLLRGEGERPAGVRRAARPVWVGRFRAALIAVDSFAAALAAAVVLSLHDEVSSTLWWASWCLVAVWPILLALTDTYSERVFGVGSEEYRRVARAGLLLLALAGFVSYAARLNLSRSLVVVAIPALALGTLILHWVARQVLGGLRRRGYCTKRVVAVGRTGAVLELVDRLDEVAHTGLEVVAACVTSSQREGVRREVTVPVGGLEDVVEMVAAHRADTVAVTSASETAAEYLRRLSWQLEGSGVELLVAPGLVEVAGPRLHIRPFEGLPLLSVEEPRFEGWRRMVKGSLDRVLAALALLLLAPVLLVIAVAVRTTSGGPVLYRQERVGVRGRPFTMIKFRSMVVGADRQLAALRDENMCGDGVLFKAREDPRVTPVGRWLRRLSLDELPQLFNVLGGSMSLVGPRPPLPTEVARYDPWVHRRLLVKPGLTGLWQISGRSDLSWDESVRLDLRYVENWSLSTDLMIMWKTGRAVLSRSGAY